MKRHKYNQKDNDVVFNSESDVKLENLKREGMTIEEA